MKYADLIRAALDGKTIQTHTLGDGSRWTSLQSPELAIEILGYWAGCTGVVAPEFRLEPPPPPPDVVLYQNVMSRTFVGRNPLYRLSVEECHKAGRDFGDLVIGVNRIVFDGVTGKLKSMGIVE